MNEENRTTPPDQNERDLIRTELDTNLLVEAAAGTGKTTSLILRMTESIGKGICTIDSMAAVTFTRKAAAEMRARFQIALEKRARETSEPERQRYESALTHSERCFIGTIHSFCARLLRERPIEAGVDLSFREFDDTEDALFLQNAWEEYAARLYANHDPLLDELNACGLKVGDLKDTFERLSRYPDVTEWPAPDISLPDLQPTIDELLNYTCYIRDLLPGLPSDPGSDKLMPKLRLLERRIRYSDLLRPVELFDLLQIVNPVKVTQKCWPGGKEQAIAEQTRWNEFTERVEPLKKIWLARRYTAAMRTVLPAIELYEHGKQRAGCLNFQDLLMKTARLLRTNPQVRDYFRRRVGLLLVDEFQDTDPIQAEIMMLLTADDVNQMDWQGCRPRPGSLFIVGDPKQSIYRFRRADIVTYNQVKSIVESNGGRVVRLSANFRTDAPILDWVNRVFVPEFPERENVYSPVYIPLQPGTECKKETSPPVSILSIPEDSSNKNEDCIAYESEFIVRTIRHELDAGLSEPGDYLIVTYQKKHLSAYAERLEAYGIPHQVTGGDALNQIPQLSLLTLCLRAVARPDDPIALVSLLRSELYGVSDPELFAHHDAGGRFSFQGTVPEYNGSERIQEIFSTLQRYALWLNVLPPAAALEKIAGDLGLFAHATISEGSNILAGSLAKAFELVRSAQGELHSTMDVVKFLERLIENTESYDGVPAFPPSRSVVRVMNLHKVKGLEAKTVFLADPTGRSDRQPELHIDRSTRQAVGYCPVLLNNNFSFKKELLAQPCNWEVSEKEETKFANAERIRLLYVAATRAKNRLIITQRTKRNTSNYWEFFQPHLTDSPAFQEPDAISMTIVEDKSIELESVDDAIRSIRKNWTGIVQPTYNRLAAKKESVGDTRRIDTDRERGTDWGEFIHALLETMMKNPRMDLSQLIENLCPEYEIESDDLEESARVVNAVMDSELWRRASSSERCLTEVPFQLLWESDAPGTVMSGVIDLVFRESDGWIIVDYKTDAAAKNNLESLIDKYRPQVALYADAWKRITGEKVVETGLFFTEINQYCNC